MEMKFSYVRIFKDKASYVDNDSNREFSRAPVSRIERDRIPSEGGRSRSRGTANVTGQVRNGFRMVPRNVARDRSRPLP